MDQKRKLNVSGYRGIWGDSLTEKIVGDYARAFGRFTIEATDKKNPTILIGRDGRESGPEIKEVLENASSGFSIAPFPGFGTKTSNRLV